MLDLRVLLYWSLGVLLAVSTLTLTFYSYLTVLPLQFAQSWSLCMPTELSLFQSSSKSNK